MLNPALIVKSVEITIDTTNQYKAIATNVNAIISIERCITNAAPNYWYFGTIANTFDIFLENGTNIVYYYNSSSSNEGNKIRMYYI